jgi:hypothetical protein
MPGAERGWSPINSGVGRLQSSCKRRASAAAGGGRRADMCLAADEVCRSGGSGQAAKTTAALSPRPRRGRQSTICEGPVTDVIKTPGQGAASRRSSSQPVTFRGRPASGGGGGVAAKQQSASHIQGPTGQRRRRPVTLRVRLAGLWLWL